MYRIEGGYVVFEDGTRVRAISGAQEDLLGASGPDLSSITDAGSYVDATQVDFVLNIGYDPTVGGGGVDFGSPDAAGYVGLSDAIRSGETADSYVGTVAVNTSLSDALRSGGQTPSGAFDESQFNPNVQDVIPSGWNLQDVIDSAISNVAKATGTAISAFSAFGKSGGNTAAKPGPGSTSQGAPSLLSKLFGLGGGLAPGASGQPVSPLLLGGAVLAFGLLIFMLGKRSS